MDATSLASIFYTLGIIVFVGWALALLAVLIGGYILYQKVKHLKEEIPARAVSFLQGRNSEGMKAAGVALVGLVISLIRRKLMKK